jgi:hypothetical protein
MSKVLTFLSDDIFLLLPMNQIVAVSEKDDEDDNYYSVWIFLSTGWAYQLLSDNECLACEIRDILEGVEVDTILHVAQIINRGKDYDLSVL